MGNILTKCCTEDVDLRKKRDHLSKTSPTLRTVNDSSSSTHNQQDDIELHNTAGAAKASASASASGQQSTLDGTSTSNTTNPNKDTPATSKRPASSFFKQISSSFTKKSSPANPKSLSLEQGLEQHFPFPLTAEERKVLLSNEIPSAEIEKLSIGVDGGGMGIIHVAEWKGIKVAIKEASLDVIIKEVRLLNILF